MNKKIIAAAATALLLSFPLASMALATVPEPAANPTLSVSGIITLLFSFFWPFIAAFVVVMFVLAGIAFINAQGDPGKVADARNFVIWGVIGLTVILLAVSIPFIVKNAFGL